MKKYVLLLLAGMSYNSFAQKTASITVSNNSKDTISRHIYGQFAEHLGHGIYGGFWVDKSLPVQKQDRIRLDIVNALKKIKIPNLRWPGGCFADEYHWRDGIGLRAQRPKMINTNWGGVVEDNSFGTHEFLELCKLLDTEPYISANVGSGTVEEMSKWVEYLNFDGLSPLTTLRKQNGHPESYKVKFWGVGNESWGCGGSMTAEHYADEYRRYATYSRDYPNARLRKIACGASDGDYNWTETMMKNVGPGRMWGLSLHSYTLPTGKWGDKGPATGFGEKEYFNTINNTLRMEEFVTKHSAIMDKYDPKKRVALVVDEWGVWTNVEPGTNPGFLYQQNSLRDALVAGTNLNIFNNHCDRVKMANLAQAVNVLQSLILTDKEKMLLTPTYYIFDMYKVHQDAKYLPIQLNTPDYEFDGKKLPAVNVSASQDKAGKIHITLVNLDAHNTIEVSTELKDIMWKNVSGQVLTSGSTADINTFAKPLNIVPKQFNGAKRNGDKLVVSLPAKSVVALELF
ncbi:alpha-L-arabinofuranosidase C-terminal domain-containing protein [Mucilaginibacter sp. PAMB04274]|uniref:alpha-N-arabinofuranosidase n=1 Tax=Mucilaginibacter sp. PAMB04274 TaxID=3138568 RepID=UPI0031F68B48